VLRGAQCARLGVQALRLAFLKLPRAPAKRVIADLQLDPAVTGCALRGTLASDDLDQPLGV
jgi:hypothetical protein